MTQLEKKLKSNKHRLTGARKAIFEILQSSTKALSPQEISREMGKATNLKADQASIYRNLSLFTEIGLAHRFQSGKYSICQHGEKSDHAHMHIVATCTNCGKTYEVSQHTDGLCQLAGGLKCHITQFQSFSGMTLVGSCKTCSQK